MIDSNETMMYEFGRDAGYSEGYEDGLNTKLETINPSQGEIVVLSVNFDEISFEGANHIFNMVQDKFPNNRVILIPNEVNLESLDNDFLVPYRNMINELIAAKEAT